MLDCDVLFVDAFVEMQVVRLTAYIMNTSEGTTNSSIQLFIPSHSSFGSALYSRTLEKFPTIIVQFPSSTFAPKSSNVSRVIGSCTTVHLSAFGFVTQHVLIAGLS